MVLPFVIAAVALGLRLYGTDWDQGNFFHPDERSIYMRADCMYRTLTDAPGWESCANRDFPLDQPGIPSPGTFLDADRSPLNPHWFPLGSVLIYALVLPQVSLAAFVDTISLEHLATVERTLTALASAGSVLLLFALVLARALLAPFVDTVSLEYLATVGRTLTALASAGSVLLLFALGKRLYGQAVGLLASALGALAVVSIQLAHFYRPEPFIVLLALASFWFMLNVVERGRWRDHLWLGVMIGLSFAFKPTSLPLLVPLALTYIVAARDAWSFYRLMIPAVAVLEIMVRGMAAGAVALATFALLEPYGLLDFGKLVGDLAWEADIARTAGLVPYTVQYIGTTTGLYELRQTTVWALGVPLGIVAWGGLLLSTARFVWRPRLGDLLLLAWVISTLLTLVAFEVKFLRYVAPILPVMVLLGSSWLITGYQWAASNSVALGRLAAVAIALVVGATAFYALAFTSIYSRPHPAVQASQWVNEQVPKGSTILTDNHWDEGIPGLSGYQVSQLPMYEQDALEKMDQLTERLAEAEYLIAYSNRPFGSIARQPDRYPLSSSYYRLLFNGGLGYQLEQAFASYPSFLGISFAHDPFTRAGVTKPFTLPGVEPRGLTLDLGYADGNVTNYDHPLVLAFRNVEHLQPPELLDLILDGQGADEQQGLLLTEDQWAIQRAGGTWTELFDERGWTYRVPWLVWLLLVEIIALAALPLAITTFRWLPDHGIVFARPLGLLLVACLTWLGASLGWWEFSRTSVLGAVAALAIVSGVLLYSRRSTILAVLRQRWRYLLGVEGLFLASFFIFLVIRAANPDLWHPWRGGEKPMDLAYLTAVVKSVAMPPYDPWYAGGYLNYYYFGQFIVASLIKATGIVPTVAYNLAVPLLFAMTVTGTFSVGYNLAESLRRQRFAHKPRWGPLSVGVAAALMVAVLANLDGTAQIVQGAWRWATGDGVQTFDFWRSSRLMPGQISITEFPFWTFLFGDLHAHLIAIPFTLLSLGLALNIALSAGGPGGWAARAPGTALLALAVGALAAINTWDVPAFGILALAAGAVAIAARPGPLGPAHLALGLAWALVVWATAYLLFLPFHASYDSPFGGVNLSQWRTALWQYVSIHSLMFFVVGSWLVVEAYRRRPQRPVTSPSPGAAAGPAAPATQRPPAWGRTMALAMAALMVMVLALALALTGWQTVGVLAFFLTLSLVLMAWWLAHRSRLEAPAHLFMLAMVAVALGIGMGVDIVTIGNDIDRMNTVFKLYLNAWVLFGIVAAVAGWHLVVSGALRWRGPRSLITRLWTAMLVLLLLSVSIFPVLGTRARLADRFGPLPLTLDGAAYQQSALYHDPGPSGIGSEPNSRYPLAYDVEALEYMRKQIKGSPVVLEAVTNQYRWTPRVAGYTGLPVVMGWEWHQTQQRGPYTPLVRQRIRDVNTMYSTLNQELLQQMLRQYQVEYIYVGPVEQLYYPEEGLEKLDAMLRGSLDIFFQSDQVTIYRVLPLEASE